MVYKKHSHSPAFTIVELLVVIVVIGILAAVTIIAYTGISQKAAAVSLQSDLSNASQQLKLFQIENGIYPTSIDCGSSPAAGSICLKSSPSNAYISFQKNNTSNPQMFCITAVNNGVKYRINNNSAPEQGTCDGALTDGLLAYYPFNGDAKDYSGNNNNGVIYGSVPDSGISGQSYLFDGVNDYVEIAKGRNLLATDSTISMWFYSTSWAHQAFVSLIGSRQIGSDGVMLFTDPAGNLSCDWGSNRWNAGYVLPLNQWVHFVITRDGLGRKLYINNVLASSTVAAGGPATADTVLRIGSVSNGTYFFQGKIDEIRIYDRALSSTEVGVLYNL